MSSAFPLIRAADIVPFIRWMRDNGRPIEGALKSIGMPIAPWEAPDRPIALTSACSVMQSLAQEAGPDIARRVVSEASISDLGALGEIMLGAGTPRKALNRLCAAISRHCTHEQFMIAPVPGGIVVREQIMLDVGGETLHIVQQYVAALIRALCLMTGYSGEPLGRIEMTAHPRLGLSHLERGLGPAPVPSKARILSVFIADEVLDRPFPPAVRETGRDEPPHNWAVLRRGKSYSSTARVFIETMLDDDTPSVECLAAASGVSLRTVQRRLAEEGTNFSALLDEVRRTRALRELRMSSTRIGLIAADLGYSGQPAFVRAVRRWAGVSPRQFRQL